MPDCHRKDAFRCFPSRLGPLTALCLLGMSSGLRAQDGLAPRLGGYVKGYAFEQAVDPYDLQRAGARLQLQLSGGSGEPAAYFGAFDFELDSASSRSGDPLQRDVGFEIYPVELYLNLTLGPLELRVGKQFVFWGRTAWVNPTDVISAWDYAHIASEIEDYRVAPAALRLSWYAIDELLVDLVWVPLFQPHRIPMVVPERMGELPVLRQSARTPDLALTSTELGLRVSHAISSLALDWALAGYVGYDKNPSISVAPRLEPIVMGPPGTPPVMIPTALIWQERYQRLVMVGGDLQKALGPFVLKAEVALKAHPDLDATGLPEDPTGAQGVIGVDYVFSENLDLGLQYVATGLLGYDVDEERTRLERQMGRAPVFVDEALTHQVTARVNFKLLPELGGQVLALYDVTYVDFMVLGFVWWDIADALKLYLGALAFGGADGNTPMARQADFSQVFAELKLSF